MNQVENLDGNVNQIQSDFGRIYEIYIKQVFRYVYNQIGNIIDAEDITSQIFLSAFESIHRYKDNGHFAAWLFTIARRKIIDYYRSNQSQAELNETTFTIRDEDMDKKVIQNERQEILKQILESLTEQEKEMIRLRCIAELRFMDIAKILKRSESATKKSYYRLISRIKNQMDVYND
jgi:RNA polymerase sigma factor (sigma-70 family)